MADDNQSTACDGGEGRRSHNGPDSRVAMRSMPRMPAVLLLLSVIALILVGAALQATQWISMPLAFAFFAALVFWPVHAAVRAMLPRWLAWLAHLAVGLMILVVVGAFLGCLWFAAERLSERAPEIGDDVQTFWQSGPVQQLLHMPGALAPDDPAGTGGAAAGAGAEDGGSAATRQAVRTAADAGDADADRAADRANGGPAEAMLSRERLVSVMSSGALAMVNSLTHAIAVFTLVLFFTILMLAEVPVWARKTANATDGDGEQTWYRATVVVSQRVRWYLVTRTLLGAATGLLYAGWLWLFDIDLLIVWFLLTLLLSFIPTLGSLVSGLLPIVYALITKDPVTALGVGLGLLLIEQVMGNFVDPRILGRRLSLSPLVLLFSLVFWGYIWGIVGALLAAPLTVLLTVVLAQWRQTVPFALLLSDETDYDGLVRSVRPD